MIPERAVIAPLVAESPPFKAFYQAERPKITLPIRWVRKRNLEYEALVHRSRAGPIVNLRRIPPRVEDAPLVAEELAHLVLDTEGFPGTVAIDESFSGLSNTINSMLHDPLIHERLAKYGFDLWQYLVPQNERSLEFLKEKNSTETMEFLKKQTGIPDPPNPQVLHWMVNYAHLVLEWEVAGRIAGPRESEVRSWLEVNLPVIAREGRNLLELVESVGYDTPQKQRGLLMRIIESYSLTDVMRLTR